MPSFILEIRHRLSVHLLHVWHMHPTLTAPQPWQQQGANLAPYLAAQRLMAQHHCKMTLHFPQPVVIPETVGFLWIISRSPPTLYSHHLFSQHSHVTLTQVSSTLVWSSLVHRQTKLRAQNILKKQRSPAYHFNSVQLTQCSSTIIQHSP